MTKAGAATIGRIFERDSVEAVSVNRDTFSDNMANQRRNLTSDLDKPMGDNLAEPARLAVADSTAPRSEVASTPSADTARRKKGAMFDDIIEGKAADSVVFDARNKKIYSYRSGDVTYQGMTLKAGTVIATGTPAGVGMGFDPPQFLKKGDVVTCQIVGIGTLENTVE